MIEVSPRKSCLFASPLAPLRAQRGEAEVFAYPFCSLPCLRGGAGDGVFQLMQNPCHPKDGVKKGTQGIVFFFITP